jgi:hypothetical protein
MEAEPGPGPFEFTVPVLVIGGGACGCIAALAARDAGAEVLLVEQDERPMGSSGMSQGLVCAAGTKAAANPSFSAVKLRKIRSPAAPRPVLFTTPSTATIWPMFFASMARSVAAMIAGVSLSFAPAGQIIVQIIPPQITHIILFATVVMGISYPVCVGTARRPAQQQT